MAFTTTHLPLTQQNRECPRAGRWGMGVLGGPGGGLVGPEPLGAPAFDLAPRLGRAPAMAQFRPASPLLGAAAPSPTPLAQQPSGRPDCKPTEGRVLLDTTLSTIPDPPGSFPEASRPLRGLFSMAPIAIWRTTYFTHFSVFKKTAIYQLCSRLYPRLLIRLTPRGVHYLLNG